MDTFSLAIIAILLSSSAHPVVSDCSEYPPDSTAASAVTKSTALLNAPLKIRPGCSVTQVQWLKGQTIVAMLKSGVVTQVNPRLSSQHIILSSSGLSMLISPVEMTDGGSYHCLVKMNDQALNNFTVMLTVNAEATCTNALFAPLVVNVKVGGSVTLPCNVAAMSECVVKEVRWMKQNVLLVTRTKGASSSAEAVTSGRLWVTSSAGDSVQSIAVNQAEKGDSDFYICEVNFENNHQAKRHLYLHVADDECFSGSNDMATVDVEMTQPLLLHCRLPPPSCSLFNVKWYQRDKLLLDITALIVREVVDGFKAWPLSSRYSTIMVRNKDTKTGIGSGSFYWCQVHTRAGLDSRSMVATVSPGPALVTSCLADVKVNDSKVSKGDSATLQCQASLPESCVISSFTWFWEQELLTITDEQGTRLGTGPRAARAQTKLSGTRSELKLSEVTADDGGVYRCRVDLHNGSYSGAAFLEVLEWPVATPTVTADPDFAVAVEGSRIVLRCREVNGSLPVAFSWMRAAPEAGPGTGAAPDEALPGEDSDTLVLTWSEQSGYYRCRASNLVRGVRNNATSLAFEVRLLPMPGQSGKLVCAVLPAYLLIAAFIAVLAVLTMRMRRDSSSGVGFMKTAQNA
ncbi:hemicentin-2-like isoform X2 [Petromyzon marinus]|nr:hemicentin-1-like isoform X2 [Petromyzon marinus]